MAATARVRHPGRRPPADEKAQARHERAVKAAVKNRDKLRKEADTLIAEGHKGVAEALDAAMADGVQTKVVAEDWMGVSRQMIHKFVTDHLGKGKRPTRKAAKSNGGAKSTAKKGTTRKAPAKKTGGTNASTSGSGTKAAPKKGAADLAKRVSRKANAKPAAKKAAPKPKGGFKFKRGG